MKPARVAPAVALKSRLFALTRKPARATPADEPCLSGLGCDLKSFLGASVFSFNPRIVALALALAADPAAALTCLPPSVETAFTAAQQADDTYLPVLGTFTNFRQRPASKTINGPGRQITARFIGHSFTAQGPGAALDVPVTISEHCLGAFCPAFAPDLTVLTFLRRDAARYALQVDACHGSYIADPTPDQIDTLRGCLRKMSCGPD